MTTIGTAIIKVAIDPDSLSVARKQIDELIEKAQGITAAGSDMVTAPSASLCAEAAPAPAGPTVLKLTDADFGPRDDDGHRPYVGSVNFDAEFEGSVEIAADLGWVRFAKSIRVTGYLEVKSGSGISAGWGISAGEGISAGWGISCKATLTVKYRVFAGIATWIKTPGADQKRITCGRFDGGTITHGDLIETGLADAA